MYLCVYSLFVWFFFIVCIIFSNEIIFSFCFNALSSSLVGPKQNHLISQSPFPDQTMEPIHLSGKGYYANML